MKKKSIADCLMWLAAGALLGAGCGTTSPIPEHCKDLPDACSELDDTRCSQDEMAIQTCLEDEDGCLVWKNTTNCDVDDKVCVDEEEGPECVDLSCVHECAQVGQTRCDGEVIQTCETGAEGCREWVDTTDCADQDKFCDDTSEPAVCSDSCVNHCDGEGQTRCAGDMIQTCEEGENGCLDWVDTTDCSQNGQTCDDSGYEAVCLTACTTNDDCDLEDYCRRPSCNAVQGVCVQRPLSCPEVWAPVCGCDGKTYGNACEAAAAGQNVDYEGECEVPVCSQNEECDQGEYCKKEGCDDSAGICAPIPEGCPEIWSPVCGCDGKTYGNACEAAAASMNIDYPGECFEDPCGSNEECGEEEYCLFAECDDQLGNCEVRPGICEDFWSPVCGCDGETYTNDCFAAMAGVSVDYEGECRQLCESNEDCSEDYYCWLETCDAPGGECLERPVMCPQIVAPVCGCDGETYDNSCLAAMAGQSVAYPGVCQAEACWGNDMCSPDEYCLFESCAAESGICTERPLTCPDIWSPVCGCDGETYGNACLAAMAGETVAYEGECQGEFCTSNHDCLQKEYCWFADCDDTTGSCLPRPEACMYFWDPVCGCDGITYDNACFAALAGVSIDYEGECVGGEACFSNLECDEGWYCFFEVCAAETGMCVVQPTVCPDVWAPVCGCDRKTYDNECFAAMAGMSIDYEGVCE